VSEELPEEAPLEEVSGKLLMLEEELDGMLGLLCVLLLDWELELLFSLDEVLSEELCSKEELSEETKAVLLSTSDDVEVPKVQEASESKTKTAKSKADIFCIHLTP